MALRFISNGKKTLRCDDAQLEAFTSQMNDDGQPIWKIVDDPNPPAPTEAEVIVSDHTNQIEIRHTASGKEAWCDRAQTQQMLDTGWELIDPTSWSPPLVEAPKAPVAEAPKAPVAEAPKAPKAPKAPVAAAPAEEVEAPAEEVTEDPVAELRAKLIGLDRTVDKFWKANGEVNITGIREVISNVTRKEVEAAFPGFNRESTPVSGSAE